MREELIALGVRPGGVLVVHARMSALGWVEGGETHVVEELLATLGPDGTLVAYVSWADFDAGIAFDPDTARSALDHGRVPERIRTWPGAVRSSNPEAGVAAIGPRADWICAPHDDGYGPASPFARIVEADGQVLMLGAPLDTATLVHHAEALAGAPRTQTTKVEHADGVTRTYVDHNTSGQAFDYTALDLPEDEIAVMARFALMNGAGVAGTVRGAECHLFEAGPLVASAREWLEARFA